MPGKHGTVEERFWKYVDKGPHPGGCWLWTGRTAPYGYGSLRRGMKLIRAHRLSWEIHNGPVPADLCVLHRCDTPSCVNPAHLFLGTQADNMADMEAKGRTRNGAPYYGEAHSQAKLTEAAVRDIRAKYATGRYSQRELAAEYEVTHTVIGDIVLRRSWKHI